MRKPKVFISYSHADREVVHELIDYLDKSQIDVWVDEWEILVGDSLVKKVNEGINDSDFLIAVLSNNSTQSKWVQEELNAATVVNIEAKKRAFILPLVVDNCEIPPLLRHRKYASYKDAPQKAFRDIVDTIRRHIQSRGDADDYEALKWVNDAPFTRLWRTALETGRFSDRFANTFRNILVEMSSENEDIWSPQVAASYLLFLSEIAKRDAVDVGLWSVLRAVIEDKKIREVLRYMTLVSTLPVFKVLMKKESDQVPRLFFRTQEDPLVNHIFEEYLDFDESRAQRAIDVLSELLELGDEAYRSDVVAAMESRMRNAAIGLDVLKPLKVHIASSFILKEGTTRNVLSKMRDRWLFQRQKRAGADDIGLASRIVQELRTEKVEPGVLKRLTELFREASKQEEHRDFSLYAHLTMLLSAETLKAIREKQGDATTLNLLLDLVTDPRIEVTLSMLALGIIIHIEFGPEALQLDDTLLPSLLRPKQSGQHRVSVVEGLCESLDVEDDFWSVNLLLQIHSQLNEGEKRAFARILRSHVKQSKQAEAIYDFIRGKIDSETLERKLGK
jgi:hypothetical protein